MFLRIPLVDPDRFLEATQHLVRPFCNWLGGLLWLLAVGWFVGEMAMHWGELTSDFADKVLSRDSLVAIVLVYPILKLVHELAHAYATKLAGAEVHEMGVMLLTLIPAPYVDASASAMIPSKWRRALVAAAGMMAELAIASGAMWVWLHAQPGFARSVAYSAMLTASVSTLVFNGNPLLRFDAYYILSDALEIPNLGARASRYYLYLAQRYLLGARDAPDPATARGERFWLLVYAPASLAYRLFTLYGIALFVASRYFVFGVALAVWMTFVSLVWPLLRGARFVLLSPALTGVRGRAILVTLGFVALIGAAVGWAPAPEATVARGLVWIPEHARVVAKAEGRFETWLRQPGDRVAVGDVLARLSDPLSAARRAKAQARLAEIEARLFAAQALSPYETQVLMRQRDTARAELADIVRQEGDLSVRSAAAGVLVAPHAADLPESFVKRGQTLAYVMSESAPVIRAAVPEAEIEYFQNAAPAVSVRFDEQPWTPLPGAALARQTPKSTRKLPSPALDAAAGGPFALDPAARDKDVMLESIFEVDIAMPADVSVNRWGQRVWVRFDHGASPLAERFYRAARQLFLGRFHV